MANFYPRQYQKVYIVNEESYGKPRGETSQWSPVSSNNSYVRRLNIIPEGVEIPTPSVQKIKKYDISDAKHPSTVVDGNIEPVTFTMDLELQYPVFLAYAVGTATTSKQTLESGTNGSSSSGTRTFNCDSGSDLSSVQAGDLLRITAGDDQGDYVIASVDDDNDQVTIEDVHGTFSGSSGVSWEIVYYKHTISEDLGASPKSFTLHCEQKEPSGSSNIYYDLLGCVVQEYTLKINRDNGTVRETVTIASPYCITSWDSNPAVAISSDPDKIYLDVYTWNNLTEETNKYLIMEGSTDKTPDSILDVELTITNTVNFLPDLSKRFMVDVAFATREVSLRISGYITNRDLMNYWQETWDSVNNRPTSASGKINSVIYLKRNSHSYIQIPIANWIITDHSCSFISIDEGIKGADISFSDAVPPSGASGKIFYDLNASSDGIIVADILDSTYYHN
ncbi:MAG: hypothetical protein ACTSUK_03890 [Promethearchaeota archaeon]